MEILEKLKGEATVQIKFHSLKCESIKTIKGLAENAAELGLFYLVFPNNCYET